LAASSAFGKSELRDHYARLLAALSPRSSSNCKGTCGFGHPGQRQIWASNRSASSCRFPPGGDNRPNRTSHAGSLCSSNLKYDDRDRDNRGAASGAIGTHAAAIS